MNGLHRESAAGGAPSVAWTAAQPMASRVLARLSVLSRVPADVRVVGFSLLLALGAAAIFALFLVGSPSHGNPAVPFAWPVVALGFFATEVKVVDIHFRREKHSFSLQELPAVVGLFLLTPAEFLVALLLGAGVALVYSRQPPIKLLFNLANYALCATLAMFVFTTMQTPDGLPGPFDWLAAFAATLVWAVLGSMTIAFVIELSDGAPQLQKLPEMIQFSSMMAVANTSLALLAICVLWTEPVELALLVVPLVVVYLAYRAYLSEREKHQRLELLYESSRILQHSPEIDFALSALLEHAREMFRAEYAEVVLWPRDGADAGLQTRARFDAQASLMTPVQLAAVHPLHRRLADERSAFLSGGPLEGDDTLRQAMAVPLLGESVLIGTMIIVNRLSEGTTFGPEDLRLLETVANQAAVALENGQLEQSLSELSRLKEELRHQAYHDPLTGLANRALFAERTDLALATATPTSVPVVLFLDLDNFKDVNDTLGHAAGDRLLVAVAERVRSCVRHNDLAARLGGDEFAVLLFDEPRLDVALSVATRLLESLAVTFPIEGQDLKVGASIGIAASRGDVDRADELLRNADVAMYTAKQGGKGRFSVFEPTMHAAIVARHTLSSELSRGIAEGEIDVFYQPIIDLSTGRSYGAEALARWRHPTRGILPPDSFIPLAEESGAILELGRSVLFEACREAAVWQPGPAGPLSVTVNLSAAQLAEDTFVAEVGDVLRATGLPASCLVLEMTETAMFHDTSITIARLSALRDLGIRVAIDDFGTGYSSLGYLRRFPVDILKIAKEFVADPDAEPGAWALANSIVGLGRTLDLRIVAEGIEHHAQLDTLRRMGCELGQGYLFARPMPGDEIAVRFASEAVGAAGTRPLPRPVLAAVTGG